MSNRTVDRYLESEQYRDQCACCECGYLRNGGHHPKIRCPRTGRCGSCGNDWPCKEHAPLSQETKLVERKEQHKIRDLTKQRLNQFVSTRIMLEVLWRQAMTNGPRINVNMHKLGVAHCFRKLGYALEAVDSKIDILKAVVAQRRRGLHSKLQTVTTCRVHPNKFEKIIKYGLRDLLAIQYVLSKDYDKLKEGEEVIFEPISVTKTYGPGSHAVGTVQKTPWGIRFELTEFKIGKG